MPPALSVSSISERVQLLAINASLVRGVARLHGEHNNMPATREPRAENHGVVLLRAQLLPDERAASLVITS